MHDLIVSQRINDRNSTITYLFSTIINGSGKLIAMHTVELNSNEGICLNVSVYRTLKVFYMRYREYGSSKEDITTKICNAISNMNLKFDSGVYHETGILSQSASHGLMFKGVLDADL